MNGLVSLHLWTLQYVGCAASVCIWGPFETIEDLESQTRVTLSYPKMESFKKAPFYFYFFFGFR